MLRTLLARMSTPTTHYDLIAWQEAMKLVVAVNWDTEVSLRNKNTIGN